MIGRRAAAALVCAALAGCSVGEAPATPSSSTPTPALTSQKCADLIVLGARGNTQSATKNFGAGTEVRGSVTAMAEQLHERTSTTVRLEGVPFSSDSGAVYTRNVFEGVDNLRVQLARLSKDCPDSRFGLVGFSQGAQIVHGFAITMTPGEMSRVDLVAMIADPRHNPDDAISYWSYAHSPTTGRGTLGAGTPIPSALHEKTISFCAAKDEVCNSPDQGRLAPQSVTHKQFYEKPASARSTGEQLAKVLERNNS